MTGGKVYPKRDHFDLPIQQGLVPNLKFSTYPVGKPYPFRVLQGSWEISSPKPQKRKLKEKPAETQKNWLKPRSGFQTGGNFFASSLEKKAP